MASIKQLGCRRVWLEVWASSGRGMKGGIQLHKTFKRSELGSGFSERRERDCKSLSEEVGVKGEEVSVQDNKH